jgi:two-component sensor histidine kinase
VESPSGADEEGAEGLRRATIDALKAAAGGRRDDDFQRLLGIAARAFGPPATAAIVLVEGGQLWFCARQGEGPETLPAAGSPWADLVNTPDAESLIVDDLPADARDGGRGGTGVAGGRFFCGVPVFVHGLRVGALGVVSPRPGVAAGPGQLATLADLARLAGSLFELKDEARVRARMAADLVKEEWRHALTLEARKVGSWVWDMRTGEVTSNDLFRRMLGLDPNRALHIDDVMGRVMPADRAAVDAAVAATVEQGVDYAVEFRAGEQARWLIGRGRVYQRDAAGKPLVMMGVNIDVTEARESAEQMRLLLRELNHRVKNTLAMIQSLARQTLRRKPDPAEFIDAFSGRLRTLSEAHALLSDRDWSGIGLVELLKSQVDPYVLDASEQLVVQGADLRLPPDQALGLGLILHELASNAVKYGALSRPDGKVTVSWSEAAEPGRRIELVWKESGGPPVVKPAEAGFGTRLIERGLDKVLDSTVELSFPAEGAEAKISLPL